MNWIVGQQVTCDGVDWGLCQVRMCNDKIVVIYCPRYELVMSGSPRQLIQAGWQAVERSVPSDRPCDPQRRQSNVVNLEQWRTGQPAVPVT
jgi:hypothetical protein